MLELKEPNLRVRVEVDAPTLVTKLTVDVGRVLVRTITSVTGASRKGTSIVSGEANIDSMQSGRVEVRLTLGRIED